MLLLFHTLQRSARWTGQQALSYFISHRPEGAPGNDVHPADAAPSLPHPAAGSDPAEATSPSGPAGMHLYYNSNKANYYYCRIIAVTKYSFSACGAKV